MSKKGSAGGKATAIIKRKESLEKYNLNPNKCLNCGSVIIPNNMQVKDVRKKKFCNHSCAATYNNKKHPHHHSTKISSGNCQHCGIVVNFNKRTNYDGFYKRKYCDSCAKIMKIKSKNQNITQETAKEVLFSSAKNWQSARSMIQKDAKEVYIKNNLPMKCKICGYDKHIDIAHIKSVSEFPNDTLISTINDLKKFSGTLPKPSLGI